MENEQGSLGNQLNNHEVTPDPKVWSNLEAALGKKRRRRGIFWFFLAGLILSLGGLTTLLLNNSENNTIVAVSEKSADLKPTVEQKQNHTTELPNQTEQNQKPEEKTASTIERETSKEGLNKTAENRIVDQNESGPSTHEISTQKPGKTKPELTFIPPVKRTKVFKSKDNEARHSKEEKNGDKLSNEKNGTISLPNLDITGLKEHEIKERNADNDNKIPVSIDTQIKDKKETQSVAKTEDNQKVAKNEIVSANLETTKESNPTAGIDSVALPLQKLSKADSSLEVAKAEIKDSTKTSKNCGFKVAILFNLKGASQRTFDLNTTNSESRTSLAESNQWNSNRLAYELSGRAEKNLTSWMDINLQVGLGLIQDRIKISVKPTQVSSYEVKGNGNQLDIHPVYTLDRQTISTQSWYASSAMGIALNPFKTRTVLRMGFGSLWSLYTKYKSTSSQAGVVEKSGSFSLDQNNLFFHAGLSQSFTMLKNKELVIEPNIQYFTKPVFYQAQNIRSTPFYIGIQFGLLW